MPLMSFNTRDEFAYRENNLYFASRLVACGIAFMILYTIYTSVYIAAVPMVIMGIYTITTMYMMDKRVYSGFAAVAKVAEDGHNIKDILDMMKIVGWHTYECIDVEEARDRGARFDVDGEAEL